MIHNIVIVRLIAVGLKRIKTSRIILLYSVLADNCGKSKYYLGNTLMRGICLKRYGPNVAKDIIRLNTEYTMAV